MHFFMFSMWRLGPPKVPWFGSYIFMLLLDRKHLHYAVNRICQFYKSTVIGFHLGEYPIVVVSDIENVKKVLNNRDFDGRPDILMGRLRHPDFELHGKWNSEHKWKRQWDFLI